jgi:hypothetical protein
MSEGPARSKDYDCLFKLVLIGGNESRYARQRSWQDKHPVKVRSQPILTGKQTDYRGVIRYKESRGL